MKGELMAAEIDGGKWKKTQERHRRWWRREGVIITCWTPFLSAPPPQPDLGETVEERWLDIDRLSARVGRDASHALYPADTAPIANFAGWGPGCLATYLGSRPKFAEDTVWFFPREDKPESWPEFRFDPENEWWRLHEATLRRLVRESEGRYLIGCPDLVENLDILCSLRDGQEVMMDMIEKPEWVSERIRQINAVWFAAYERIWNIIKAGDGSGAYHAFGIWGDGKTAKLQCDSSAMISEDMFDEFVVPALSEQAAWLDNAVYHLDGTQALRHLDSLLAIPGLDAIEWTPQAGIEGGGDKRWYDVIRRIIEAGKAVMTVHVAAADVIPLLDAVGPRGIFLHVNDVNTAGELDALAEEVHRRF
jgi:hypothetical protein